MKYLNKFSDIIHLIEKVFVVLAVGTMFLSLTFGVIFRYVLKSPLGWSTELSMYCLTIVTFIGASMMVKRQQSSAVEIFVDKLPSRVRGAFILFSSLFVFIFCAFLVYLSIHWLSSPNLGMKRSADMNIPLIFPYSIVLIGFVFMGIHSLILLLNQYVSFKEKKFL